jgi:outer membrane protein OmpA-like peptidoglycan-associated protein
VSAIAVGQQYPTLRGSRFQGGSAKRPGCTSADRHPLASLPSALGNQAFTRLIERRGVELAAQGDPREREATGIAAYSGRQAATDTSKVQIHTDEQAARMASALESRAFTIGTDIFFGAGEYDPASVKGRQLLDHEMAHATLHADESRPVIFREPLSVARGMEKREPTLTPDIPAPQVFRSEGGATLATVYFGQDSFLLGDPAAFKVVTELGDQLRFLTDATVNVDGHASGEGTAAHNVALSEKRRQAVIAILSSSLRTPVSFGGKPHGESQPAEQETGSGKALEQQRARNRRVEIFIGPRPVLEEPKKQKPFELFPRVDPRPETPEERLNRIIKQEPPESLKKRSVSDLVLKKVDERVDRILSRTGLSRKWRDRIRKAARSAVTGAAEKALDTVLDQSGLNDQEKAAIKNAVKAAAQTPAL